MTKRRARYLSYLLRLWQTNDGGKWHWRALLESSGSRERRGFNGLESLFDFLKAQTEVQSDCGPGEETQEEKPGLPRSCE